MSVNRRVFVKNAAMAAAASWVLPAFAGSSRPAAQTATAGSMPFGIQLWTVKEDMTANAKETLAKLAGYGYQQIESFE